MSKKLEDLVWAEFEKTGNTGAYMLYNALKNKEKEFNKKLNGKNSGDYNQER